MTNEKDNEKLPLRVQVAQVVFREAGYMVGSKPPPKTTEEQREHDHMCDLYDAASKGEL